MQFLGFASVAAVLVVAGVSAASTLKNDKTSETTSEGTVVPEPKAAGPTKTAAKSATPKPIAPVVQQSVEKPAVTAPVVPVAAPTPAPSRPPVANAGYVLVEGKTQLTDSIYAMRTGDSVVVNFDAFGFRTRRSAKLEQALRLTLPMVFGKMAIASIDTVAVGSLVTSKDVVGELAGNGMQMRLDNGVTVHVRVLTRPVTDGPIAIGYVLTLRR